MTDKIDWKRKLTSRKFWLAVIGLVTGLIVAFGGSKEIATEVSGIIMSAGSLIAYIIGEGMIDKERVKQEGDDQDVNITIE